jgi:hypothetical protein
LQSSQCEHESGQEIVLNSANYFLSVFLKVSQRGKVGWLGTGQSSGIHWPSPIIGENLLAFARWDRTGSQKRQDSIMTKVLENTPGAIQTTAVSQLRLVVQEVRSERVQISRTIDFPLEKKMVFFRRPLGARVYQKWGFIKS